MLVTLSLDKELTSVCVIAVVFAFLFACASDELPVDSRVSRLQERDQWREGVPKEEHEKEEADSNAHARLPLSCVRELVCVLLHFSRLFFHVSLRTSLAAAAAWLLISCI